MSLAKRQLEMQFGRQRRYAFDRAVPAQTPRSVAYDRIKQSGALNEKREWVLEFLRKHGEATQQEFARSCRLEINCVTAPFRELETAGKIKKCGKKKGDKGYNNTLYRLV